MERAEVAQKAAKKRIGWVDVAKAFAIVAIVVGHFAAFFSVPDLDSYVPWAHNLLEFCYSFHVPLFFILSGYCMKDAVMAPKKIASMFAKTFLPYLVTGAFIIAVGMTFSEHTDITEWLAALAYGSGGYGTGEFLGEAPFGVVAIGVIWFLPALFISKLVVTSTSRIPLPIRVPLLAACFFIGMWSANTMFLPMSCQEGLVCSWYVFVGAMLKRFDVIGKLTSYAKAKTTTQMIGVTVCHVYLLAFGLWYMFALTSGSLPEPNYCISRYDQPLLDFFGVVAVSIVVCMFSVRVERFNSRMKAFGNAMEKGLELLGRSTLPVFCFHGVTIAWATPLIQFFAEVSGAGADPAVLLVQATLADLAVSCAAAYVCYLVPGLHYTYFPGSKSPLTAWVISKKSDDGDGRDFKPTPRKRKPKVSGKKGKGQSAGKHEAVRNDAPYHSASFYSNTAK